LADPTIALERMPDEEVERRVLAIIAKAMDRPVSEVKPNSSLELDLGAQSLDYLDIAFSLEREFRIQFPRADFMQRAADHFGEQNLVRDGVITDFGLELLARGMPELNPGALKSGLKISEVREMFVVATFIRVVKQLLDVKWAMDTTCPDCRATLMESASLPEFVCPACGKVVPLPSGDDVLFDHVVGLDKLSAKGTAS
jgi:acyl carrier protein